MAGKLRIEHPGAIYHVLNRGDHREDIFRNEQDRELFLAALGEACQKTGWQVHAFCLMSNHFHLVVETPEADLVSAMKWFRGVYSGASQHGHPWPLGPFASSMDTRARETAPVGLVDVKLNQTESD